MSLQAKPAKPELTKQMQDYLDLHRHAAVRCELLNHQAVALRLCVAQVIAGTPTFRAVADSQHTRNDATKESLQSNKASDIFDFERCEVRKLLGMDEVENDTLIPRKDDWDYRPSLHEIFSRLNQLSDKDVLRILNFIVAETLTSSTAMVEVLGDMLNVNMMNYWEADEAFFNLLRDKEAINAMLKHIGGKAVADGNLSSTAKIQKGII